MIDKEDYLKMAVEIAKEYARGGAGSGAYDGPAEVLERAYEKLVKLGKTTAE
ncbi:MAG: hypothetical protein WAV23_01305 [Minisyncoccia bacterium]